MYRQDRYKARLKRTLQGPRKIGADCYKRATLSLNKEGPEAGTGLPVQLILPYRKAGNYPMHRGPI